MQVGIVNIRRMLIILIVKNSCDDIVNRINEYEERFALKFPDELVKFLKKYNGGETPNTRFITHDFSSDIRFFRGLGNVKYSINDVECIQYNGEKLLPIAGDTFGNVYFIQLSGVGKIFFGDHETNKKSVVANSLKEFISNCESKPISEAARRSPSEREEILIKNGKGHNISEGLRNMWQIEYDKYKNVIQSEVIL